MWSSDFLMKRRSRVPFGAITAEWWGAAVLLHVCDVETSADTLIYILIFSPTSRQ